MVVWILLFINQFKSMYGHGNGSNKPFTHITDTYVNSYQQIITLSGFGQAHQESEDIMHKTKKAPTRIKISALSGSAFA